MSMFPLAHVDVISLDEANVLLKEWGHRMGPIRRPIGDTWAHALFHEGRPVAVATTSSLIREHVGGGLAHLTREDTVELSRLCSSSRHLNRVMLRLWREFVLPLRAPNAISYQDADMHTGNTYRFDGWARAGFSRSGTDPRGGAVRRGRRKWIWVWPPEAAEAA